MSAPLVDVPAQFQTFLAFDFGLKRTGVAVGNRMLRTATGQPTIHAEGSDARLVAAEARVKEWQPDALVVGVPFHPDGNAGPLEAEIESEESLEMRRDVDERRGHACPAPGDSIQDCRPSSDSAFS